MNHLCLGVGEDVGDVVQVLGEEVGDGGVLTGMTGHTITIKHFSL